MDAYVGSARELDELHLVHLLLALALVGLKGELGTQQHVRGDAGRPHVALARVGRRLVLSPGHLAGEPREHLGRGIFGRAAQPAEARLAALANLQRRVAKVDEREVQRRVRGEWRCGEVARAVGSAVGAHRRDHQVLGLDVSVDYVERVQRSERGEQLRH